MQWCETLNTGMRELRATPGRSWAHLIKYSKGRELRTTWGGNFPTLLQILVSKNTKEAIASLFFLTFDDRSFLILRRWKGLLDSTLASLARLAGGGGRN